MDTIKRKTSSLILSFLYVFLAIGLLLIVNKWLEYHARGLQANDLIGASLLIIFGVVVLIFGDKKLNVKAGMVLKMVSLQNFRVRLIKWFVGLLSILVGLSLIQSYF
jgi:hypothetical protein